MKETDCKELNLNPFKTFPNDWLVLGAGNENDGYSAMAISWGHFGAIYGHDWGQPSVVIYVRPQRRTRHYVDLEDTFSLSLLPPKFKQSVLYLGQHSGGDSKKIQEAKLTPAFYKGVFYIKEAKTVFICRKVYRDVLDEENFFDKTIIKDHYPNKDFHFVYIGQIEKTLIDE